MICAAKQLRVFERSNGDIRSDYEGVNQRKVQYFPRVAETANGSSSRKLGEFMLLWWSSLRPPRCAGAR